MKIAVALISFKCLDLKNKRSEAPAKAIRLEMNESMKYLKAKLICVFKIKIIRAVTKNYRY